MKKYIKPEIDIVNVALDCQILAAVSTITNVEGEKDASGNSVWYAPTRKSQDLWGFDEDE